MLGISGGDPSFRDDDGSAHPDVTAALTRFAAGHGSEHDVLTALAGCRLLVPVVAVLDSESTPAVPEPALRPAARSEKATDLAMPTLIGRDGRRALPAFTSIDSLKRWQADARPVPAVALSVWQAACAETGAVVVDVAGPVPFAVEGARLAALANGAPPPLPADDPDVREVVADALARQLEVASFELEPADDHDLAVVLTLTAQAAGGEGGAQAAQLGAEVVSAVMTRLGSRLRRGVAVYLADEPTA